MGVSEIGGPFKEILKGSLRGSYKGAIGPGV